MFITLVCMTMRQYKFIFKAYYSFEEIVNLTFGSFRLSDAKDDLYYSEDTFRCWNYSLCLDISISYLCDGELKHTIQKRSSQLKLSVNNQKSLFMFFIYTTIYFKKDYNLCYILSLDNLFSLIYLFPSRSDKSNRT